MPDVTGVILAGGRGSRLGGVIKANMQIGDSNLITRVKQRLVPQVQRMLLSIGPFATEDFDTSHGMPCIADPEDIEMGPVGGLIAAIRWCTANAPQSEFLLTVAVDTPFFPRDFARRAFAVLQDDDDVIMARADGHLFPTNALWRLSALRDLPVRVAARAFDGGLRHVIASDRTQTLDYPSADGHHPFENINTPEDYERLQQVVAGRAD